VRYSEAAWLGFATADHLPDDARFRLHAPVVPALPVLADNTLRDLVAGLTPDELKSCLMTRLLPLPDATFAACGRPGLLSAERSGVAVTASVQPERLIEAIRLIRGEELRLEATHQLHRKAPRCSAKRHLSLGQAVTAMVMLAALSCGLFWGYGPVLLDFAMLGGALLFLAVVAIRVLVLLPGSRPPAPLAIAPRAAPLDEAPNMQ